MYFYFILHIMLIVQLPQPHRYHNVAITTKPLQCHNTAITIMSSPCSHHNITVTNATTETEHQKWNQGTQLLTIQKNFSKH